MANFVVIKGGSQYNAVIGRPTLQALRAITSVYHQKVKFPTPNGVGKMKSNQYEARVTYSDALHGYGQPGRQELVEIQVDEVESTKVLKVGLGLAPSLKGEIENFLRKNLDVFAWNHSDMEGIDAKLSKTMEVYVDDMLVKSSRASHHVNHLGEMFGVLRKYHMKLNPQKCAFGVGSGKFLSFMVSNRGIEANPEKIKALQDMWSPTKPKEVQRLTGCVAALNRFVSKATNKCVPFFDALKGSKRFEWTPQCEEAFQKLKEHLGKPPILSKPNVDEELSLYLSVSQHAISSVLVREEERVQLSIYYVSKRLGDAESRYSEMERLAVALMVASRKLRYYFQSHTIWVLTNHLLRQALQKPKTSGRLLKWSRHLIISPKGHKITSAVRFKFKASNNEAEYEALIAGLRLASHLKIERLNIFSDSQLVIAQVKEEYQAHGEKMGAYLRKLASSRESDTLGVIPIEELEQPTIEEKVKALIVQVSENWMTPLIHYLMDVQLPNDKDEARQIRYRATRYLLYDGLLYRRGYSTTLQRCLDDAEAQKVLHEIHEGV
ncbi:uncharacterized protein LOC21407623 [Morus notabilis]|uniref:uncharacterized protein LOC21407623 n=1 Tax=Morus notabilis TaxID=981085 RepID=UPI000CED534F|nr:uncharacterized protein LOC21407623 [Morus notabilis]